MITSLILEWHNWAEQCVFDLSQSRIKIYRNTKHIVYEEFDGRGNVLLKQEGDFFKHSAERFFYNLEEINADMTCKNDYSVDVCDGSCWEMKIRHSGNRLQKLKGTVEYPPHGKRIEKEMLRLCEEANIFEPHLFGCYRISLQSVTEFADKWLDIFMRVPPEADSLFGDFMEKECFSIGFEMDCGHSFERTYKAYSNGAPLNTPDGLSQVIDKVDSVEILGNAIFSNARAINYWSYESAFTENNKKWFVMALTRLKTLATGSNNAMTKN